MTKVQIPEDFLGKVVIGRCNQDFKYGCSPPEGQITDFNIWDKFQEESFLEDWTVCRWLNLVLCFITQITSK